MIALARLTIACLFAAACGVGLGLVRASPVPLPSDAGVETLQVIDILKTRLLSASSATAVLEAWCAERGLFDDAHLVAERLPGPDKPLTPEQRLRLRINANDPVRYRRVRLACGAYILSEADNWYVPARLTPEMNRVLDTTRTPFGRVVRPIEPSRRNLYAAQLWTPTTVHPPLDEPLFTIAAVLSTGDGVPFCEVAETYTGAVLAVGVR